MTLPQLAYFKLAVLLHKLTNNCLKFTDIPINIDCRKVSLRISPDTLLAVDRAKTNYGKRRISFIGSQLWNQLEPSIKNIKSLPHFKKELKNMVICKDSSLKNIFKI